MTGVAATLGAVLGFRFKILIVPSLSCAAMALLFGSLPYLFVLRKRSKRLGMFEEQFPEALDFLGRALRAGHAFSVSLEMLADESRPPGGVSAGLQRAEPRCAYRVGFEPRPRVPLLDVSFVSP
jgi:tight adherence protein B